MNERSIMDPACDVQQKEAGFTCLVLSRYHTCVHACHLAEVQSYAVGLCARKQPCANGVTY